MSSFKTESVSFSGLMVPFVKQDLTLHINEPNIFSPNTKIKNSTFCPHNVFRCLACFSQQTAIISLNNISQLVFVTVKQIVEWEIETVLLSIVIQGTADDMSVSVWSGRQNIANIMGVLDPWLQKWRIKICFPATCSNPRQATPTCM